MDHHHELASLDCNGQELGHEYGSWIGHILPGAVFIVWGVWHMLNVFWSYTDLLSHDGHDRRFRSLANYQLHVGGGRQWPVESVLKVVAPVVGMSMELWTGGSYQALVCEKNTAHPGWFHGDNINNWQHAVLYPPIILSGLVDLLSGSVTLPRGAQHAFLALVFLFESLIMGSHTKPVPLDNVVHQYLAVTSSVLALVTLVETCVNRHVLVATARSALMVLQGTWLCAIGRIMFEHRPAWDTHTMAPHDYIPVLYCWHIVFIAAGAVGLYLCVAMWQEHVAPRLGAAYSPLAAQGADGSSIASSDVARGGKGDDHDAAERGAGGALLPVSTRGEGAGAPSRAVVRHQRHGSGSSSELEMSSYDVSPGSGSDHEQSGGEARPLMAAHHLHRQQQQGTLHHANPAYGAQMNGL